MGHRGSIAKTGIIMRRLGRTRSGGTVHAGTGTVGKMAAAGSHIAAGSCAGRTINITTGAISAGAGADITVAGSVRAGTVRSAAYVTATGTGTDVAVTGAVRRATDVTVARAIIVARRI